MELLPNSDFNNYKNSLNNEELQHQKVEKPKIDENQTGEENLTYNNLLSTQNSFESLNWKYHLLSHAEESIEFSPNYCGDLEFQVCLLKIQQSLEKKPNLKVHILLSEDFLKSEEKDLLKELQEKFPIRFNYLITGTELQITPYLGSKENHQKVMIVDDKYFVLGGSGVKSSMSTKGDETPKTNRPPSWKDDMVSKAFRDMDVVGEGNLAKSLRQHFYDVYQSWESKKNKNLAANRSFEVDPTRSCKLDSLETDPLLVKNVATKAFFSNPNSPTQENPISREISSKILSATKNVHIAQMNFNPDPIIKTALETLKKTKPDVKTELLIMFLFGLIAKIMTSFQLFMNFKSPAPFFTRKSQRWMIDSQLLEVPITVRKVLIWMMN
jgi:phosphatidylserine/phosphatidylglycerophosphate/cardiolipin synthase-like enzyme